ncbi:hypothetical protein DFJ77DRAFT_451098 [Powellomyces hirtus]|nr:hypothetical protein DFJ77DRAFT_451098 [Powellomyces hirtus]
MSYPSRHEHPLRSPYAASRSTVSPSQPLAHAPTSPVKRERAKKGTRKAQPAWNPTTAKKSAPTKAPADGIKSSFNIQPCVMEPEPRIVWTTSYQTESEIMASRLARQLPRTSKLTNEVRPHTALLRADIQPIFDLLDSSVAHITRHADHRQADTLLVRYFQDYRDTVASFLHDCFADRHPDASNTLIRSPDCEVKDVMRLCQSVVEWNKVHIHYMDILTEQEDVVQDFLKQFGALEEENVILRDVLAQRSGGVCEVTVRRIVQEPVTRKRQMVDRSTDPVEMPLDEPTTKVIEALTTTTEADTPPVIKGINAAAFAIVLGDIRSYNRRQQKRKEVVDMAIQTVPERVVEKTHMTTQTWVDVEPVAVIRRVNAITQVVPEAASAECQTCIPHPAELEVQKSLQRIAKLEAQLRETLQAHDETIHAIKKENEAEKALALQHHENEKKRILRDREEMIGWVKKSEQAKTDAVNSSELLQGKCDEFMKLVEELRAGNAILSESKQGVENALATTTTELAQVQEDLYTVRLEYEQALQDQSELRESFNEVQNALSETMQQARAAEDERRLWEEKASKATESEARAVETMRRAQEDSTYSREGTQKLVDSSLELERMLAMSDQKNKEISSCLNAVMKYPDASLGHEISMAEVGAPGGGGDKILKDMITGNSVRISLLEQKNNELRVLRLKLASSAQNPMTTPIPRATLVDKSAVQRATESITLQYMEQQSANRSSSAHPPGFRPPARTSQPSNSARIKAALRPATQTAWTTLKTSVQAPSMVSRSLTKYPPEDYVQDVASPIQQGGKKSLQPNTMESNPRWNAARTNGPSF